MISALSGSGKDVSGGSTDIGKREYSIRFSGKYDTDELGELIIHWRDGYPVYLRDVARVEKRLVDKNSFVIARGGHSIAVNAKRETGVNVLEVMDGIQAAIKELDEGPMARAGLSIEQVYNETVYIDQSIDMLRNNLALGIFLAIVILWLFLRKIRATLTVALAIPVCLISSFLLMHLAGRTLNVISMAGLAFAVGMVLDASIVVLENIIRLREKGVAVEKASEQGALQVLGALTASTATTVAIFLPIVFLEGEAGQLFADLALTVTAAICLSFIVATTVIPAFAMEYMGNTKFTDTHQDWWDAGSEFIMKVTSSAKKRYTWIVVLITIPLFIGYLLIPEKDYLPEGNRNLAIAFILPPPGANITQVERELGAIVAERLAPHINEGKQPAVRHYFFVGWGQGVFMGVVADDPKKIDEVLSLTRNLVAGFPDVIAFINKASLFGGVGEGRTIDMDIQGRDIGKVMEAAMVGFLEIQKAIPGATAQPMPGLELAQPELRLIPNERRITEAGWNRAIMAGITRAVSDGLYVGDYFDGEKTMDIIVRAEPWETPEELGSIPLATPNAGVLSLNELVDIVRTSGPEEIRRVNRRRTVTLRVTPPKSISLESAIQILKNDVEGKIRDVLPEDGDITYAGSADKLQIALEGMQNSFLLAIAILYLLMSALFRSFRDSLLVILALPLATVGGVIALFLMNTLPGLIGKPVFQPMDLITMIGFIILLGLVVNNAILLVHQSRAGEREGLNREEAVRQAVRQRLRPIIMSTLTSIFGMLPLLLMPGAGTELYRGMAGVIVGGMSVSTIFTLVLLPSLLRMGEEKNLSTG
jgi:multidrug efflux pump subunit AcrB